MEENLDISKFIMENEFIVKQKCVKTICKIGSIKMIEIAFVNACMSGSIKDVEYILEKFAINPNLGIVPACRFGNLQLIKILLNHCANPNYIDPQQKNMTPLIAVMLGNGWDDSNKDIIVNELVKCGANMTPHVFGYINEYLRFKSSILTSNSNIDFDSLKYIF